MKITKFKAYDTLNKVWHNDFQFIKSGDEGNDWIIFTSDKQKLNDEPHPFNNPHFQQQFIIMENIGIDTIQDGMFYDDNGNVYVVENGECKTIGNFNENPDLLEELINDLEKQ